MATPTRISEEDNEPTIADPEPPPVARAGLAGAPSSLTAPLPGEGSGLSQLPETELSNSWREAILDNRPTVAMLKKMGLPGPAEGSTASGAAVTSPVGSMPPPPVPPPFVAAPDVMEPTVFSDPPAPAKGVPPAPWSAAGAAVATADMMEPTVFSDPPAGSLVANAPAPPAPPTKPASVRVATPPRPFVKEGSSQLLSLATGAGACGIIAAQLWNGSWAAGLSGWLAFGAACFIAAGGLLNSLLRGPGSFAVAGVTFLAAVVAVGGMLAVFLTGGPRTRLLAESHDFLAPLAAYERSLSKGPPVEPTPAPEDAPSPSPATSITPAESPAPTATP